MEQMIYLGIFGGIIALLAASFYSKKVQSYEINIPRVAEIQMQSEKEQWLFFRRNIKF